MFSAPYTIMVLALGMSMPFSIMVVATSTSALRSAKLSTAAVSLRLSICPCAYVNFISGIID